MPELKIVTNLTLSVLGSIVIGMNDNNKDGGLYNDVVMDRFLNPKNIGDIENADGIGEVGAAACGDIMKLSLKIKDGVIEDARFKTFGCGTAIASADMACSIIKGKTIEEAEKMTNDDIIAGLISIPPVKIHCSVLGEEAVKAAIEDYKKRKESK